MFNLSLNWVLDTDGLLQDADLPSELQESNGSATSASVLIPLYWYQQQWYVLFIRRVANSRDRHSGQVAFPVAEETLRTTLRLMWHCAKLKKR